MIHTLAIKDGALQLPKELLEKSGFPTTGTVTVRPEADRLIIQPASPQSQSLSRDLDEDAWPVFVKEPDSPLYVTEWLEEGDKDYLDVAYSDEGLVTRAEFMSGLRSLEAYYGMSSAKFYEKWQRGEFDETIDLIMWANDCEALQQGTILFKDEHPLEEIVGRRDERKNQNGA